MGIALPTLDRPLRLSADPALSREEFWRLSADYPNMRMERAASGEVIVMSPTHGGTSQRNAAIIRVLGNWAEADGRGIVLDSNAGCELSDGSILSPDAAWISLERWTPPPPDKDAPVPCPDFVIELRSSSDRLKPLHEKMEAWIANGCELAWLVDPLRKAVEIYRPHQEPEIQENPSATFGEGPVAGLVLKLAGMWR